MAESEKRMRRDPAGPPKASFRFKVSMDPIDPWTVAGLKLPKHTSTVDAHLVPVGMASLFLCCPIAGETERAIDRILKKQRDDQLDDAIVDFYDAIGSVVSTYRLVSPTVVFFEWSKIDYKSEDPLVLEMTFKYERLEIQQE